MSVADTDSLKNVWKALAGLDPNRIPDEQRKIMAAVAVIVRNHGDDIEVLLIQRADDPRDPWSGQMAFPGGKVDAGDDGARAAAIRETSEEIGLDLERYARVLGRLSDATPLGRGRRLGFVIVPHVFELDGDPELIPNDEVQGAVWVPLEYLRDRSNRSGMWWRRGIFPMRFPCCRYQGHIIWGVTLRILDELLNVAKMSA
jgi:8-oxo-dGTP pyrophosphatase MutT (NUDIX family)